jgi:hypothetical protein
MNTPRARLSDWEQAGRPERSHHSQVSPETDSLATYNYLVQHYE